MPRKLLLLAAVLLLTAAATAGAAPGRQLVLVYTGEDRGPALAATDLDLLAQVPDGYLALLDAGQIAGLRGRGVDVADLVADDPAYAYLVQYDTPLDHRTTALPPAAEVLHREPGYRVVRLPADEEAHLSCLPDIQRVFRRPLRFVQDAWTEPPARDVVDPVIVDIVASVQQSFLENTVQTLQNFGTRHSETAGGLQAMNWLRDQFLGYGYLDVALHDYNGWSDNVVCTKPGTVQPEKVVVIGGHYDSTSSNYQVAPGADDNATGTTGVLAAAQAFAGVDFEYTVVFIAFSGEEQGLVGSEYWASLAQDQGLDVVGMINMDMLGYRAAGDAADIDIISNTASQPLRDLVDQAVALYVPEHTVVSGSLPFGASSDHASFWANGYRAILFFEDSGQYSPYIHSASDVVGTSANDFPFMTLNVRTALATSAMLARPFTISIVHQPLAHQESGGPFPIVAEVLAAGEVAPGSVTLHHRTDGGAWTDVAMASAGEPDRYAAEIPAQAPGALVEYYLSASDTEGRTATNPDGAPDAALHAFRTGVEYVFWDDAETDQGWTFGGPGDFATTGLWIRADPVGTDYQPEDDHTPDPGHICFVTGNGPVNGPNGDQDVDGGQTTLLSPVFDLTGATWAEIGYWRYYVDETSHDDDFLVDISDDGGATWQPLEVVDDTDIPWVHAVFALPLDGLELTDQMRLRFIAYDEGDGSLVEALVDDVSVAAVRTVTAVPGSTPPAVAALGAVPNPFNPQTVLRWALPRPGEAALRVFDARGREVARPVAGPLPAGPGEVVWSARGLPSGLYLARLSLDGEEIATSKLMLVR